MSRMNRKFLFLVVCIVLLVLGIVQQAVAQSVAQPAALEPEGEASIAIQPGVWYGLIASLAGTVVFWASVVVIAKRKKY